MIQYLKLSSIFFALFTLIACKPDPHPKSPNYAIEKPKVKYKPSKKNLNKMVKKLQGSPYVWAEEGPNQFDCSGFTYYMYGSMGIDIPRVAREQAKVGQRISMNNLQYGDLIFFATSKSSRKKITHVGMYLGEGWFTHASTVKNEVIYSNLFTSKYYKKHLRICRRYLPTLSNPEHSWQKPTNLPHTQAAKKSVETSKVVILPTPTATVQNPIEISLTGTFYIQVGSFQDKPNETLLYNIAREGFKHKIIRFPQNGKIISKLLIGPFKTRNQTREILEKVKQTIQTDAFIAEIR